MIHVWAWAAWLAAVLAALSATRNPLHLILVLLCLGVVHAAVERSRQQPASSMRLSPTWQVALVIVGLAALVNGLSVPLGETVLVRIPAWVPLFGDRLTLEATLVGALNGLALVGLLLAFTTMQSDVSVSALIQLVPKAFGTLAVMTTIALTFVPNTVRQAQLIRDAQRIRGHQVRSIRDWLPLLLPLLVGGLERAFDLAETLAARGFGAASVAQHGRARLLLAGGLVLALIGWVLVLFWQLSWLGWLLLLAGSGLALLTIWRIGRRSPRTRYSNQRWQAHDTAIVLGAAVTLLAFVVPVPGIQAAVVQFSPYPQWTLPQFDVVLGLMTLGLVWPAIVSLRPETLPLQATDTA
jgi:energy-coupling factor transport system permease protein